MGYEILQYRWITRTSKLSGKTRKVMLGATPAQWESYEHGTSIQYALPHLSANEREFLLTGITQDEWDTLADEA